MIINNYETSFANISKICNSQNEKNMEERRARLNELREKQMFVFEQRRANRMMQTK